MSEFNSEGFDLDALASATDAVLELGGNVVPDAPAPSNAAAQTLTEEAREDGDPLKEAEVFKQLGNECFKKGDWRGAHDLYSDAISATPGMTGAELVTAQKAWQENQRQKMREEMRSRDLERSKRKAGDKDETSEEIAPEEKKEPAKFVAPPHPHGTTLAVYYCNRAAASMQLAQDEDRGKPTPVPEYRSAFDDADDAPPLNPRLEEAAQDCSVSLLLHPCYVKALVRRSTAYERMNNTEAALQDLIAAQKIEPHNSTIRTAVVRLQKIEDDRMEKLKTETMAKLKDLGNSILGNFGLSLDSFNAQKDPNTGSYNISFNQK